MQNLVKVFKALGDANRIRILKMLQDQPMSVGDLTAVLGIAQPCVSRHLHQLREAGLVTDERRALRSRYRLATAAANQYVPVLLRHIHRWANQDSKVSADQRLARRVERRAAKKRA